MKKVKNKIFMIVGLLLILLWLFRKPLAEQLAKRTGQLTDVALHKVESVLIVAAVVLVVIFSLMMLPLIWKIVVILAVVVVGIAILRAMRNARGGLNDSPRPTPVRQVEVATPTRTV